MDIKKEWYTSKEICFALGLKNREFYKLRQQGLPCVTKKPFRFNLEEVKRWLIEENNKCSQD